MRLRATKLSAYGGSARRLWTPAQLTTSLWLDAADASTITLNGSTVSQWNDKSGNSRNAVQATTTYQPLYAQYQNLLVYSQDFANAAWSKSRTDIVQNLVLRSQEFENASWNNSGFTVTANATTAPDGTNTARSLTETATAFAHNMYQTRSLAANRYTYSVYVKSNGRQYATVRLICGSSDWSGIAVDILNATGTLTTAGTVLSNVSSSVTSVGDGWVRVVLTVTSSATITDCVVGAIDSATPTYTTFGNVYYAGDITKGIYVWGAQWVRGALAQDYTATTSAAVAISFADPIGGTTAQKVLEGLNTTATFTVRENVTTAASAQFTASFYVKAGERTNCAIGISDNVTGDVTAIFNLSTGTLVTSSAGGAWSGLATAITSAGSGWYRVSVTGTRGAGTTTTPYVQMVQSGSTTAYTGDGQSGVYAWGGQLNSGAIQPYQRTIGIASPGGVNSKPSVVTDGSDDALFVNSWGVISQPFTRAFVFNPVVTANNTIYSTSANINVPSANASQSADYTSGATLLSQFAGSVVNSVTIAANSNYIRVSEFATTNARVYMNGVGTGPADCGAATLNGICIGGESATGSGAATRPSNVRFGEVLIIPGVLSTDDRQKLEGYLAWKWGGA
jgi:hypothetical protein